MIMAGRTPPAESLIWVPRLAPTIPLLGDPSTPNIIDQAFNCPPVEGVRSHHQLTRAPTRDLRVGKGPSGVDKRIKSAIESAKA